MIPALLTTVLFSLSAIFATRTARSMGSLQANFWRLLVALALLGLWTWWKQTAIATPALPWLLLSGMVGFGLGDVAMFFALTRIGPRLTLLLCQCLAAPFAAFMEWQWLGTTLAWPQILSACIILAGVSLALLPRSGPQKEPTRLSFSGIGWGVLSALGQAGGAVFSRKAYETVNPAFIDGGVTAFQRGLGGIVVAGAAYGLWFLLRKRTVLPPDKPSPLRLKLYIVANALAGPTLGVACYQWALATAPSGVVLPIVAMVPVVIIPLTSWIEGDHPSRRAVAGALLAVAGAALLCWFRSG
jgi:drug/metabolite transporter (DMT)-like permease